MNQITQLIILFISGIFINIFYVSFYNDVLNKKMKLKSLKITILIIIMTIIEMLINIFIKQPFAYISSFIYSTIAGLFFTDKKLTQSIIITIIFEIVIIVSELIILGIVNLFTNDYQSLITMIFSNFSVPIIGIIILKTTVPNKIYNFLIKSTKSIRRREIITYSILVIIVIVISTMESYMNLRNEIVLITNTVMALVIITIIVLFITTKSNYQSVSNKYKTSITSLREYEELINKYSIDSHENKNELQTIREMIVNKEDGVIKYIDKLVNHKIKNNRKINYKSSKIPEGGLRAIIFSKLSLMDEYKIKYKLDVAKNFKTVDIINMDDDLVVGLCGILGVFLDNAIDAVKDLKNKHIVIELYVIENDLYIDITNNFEGKINIDRVDNLKYTTKGKGHGYGLSLVNQIIEESNGAIENEKRITGNEFTQTLKIKM